MFWTYNALQHLYARPGEKSEWEKDEQTIWVSSLYIIFNDYSKFSEPRLVDSGCTDLGRRTGHKSGCNDSGRRTDINQHALIWKTGHKKAEYFSSIYDM